MKLWRTATSRHTVRLYDFACHGQSHNRLWAKDRSNQGKARSPNDYRYGVVFDFFNYGGDDSSRTNWFLAELNYNDIVMAITELAKIDERARVLADLIPPNDDDPDAIREQLGLDAATRVIHE